LLQFVVIAISILVFFAHKANRLGMVPYKASQDTSKKKKLKFTEKLEKSLTEKQIKRATHL